MDKRTVQIIFITTLFFIAYGYLMSVFYPSYYNKQPLQTKKNISQKTSQPSSNLNKLLPTTPPFSKEKCGKLSLDNIVITYCATGGYVKNVYIKKYNTKTLFENIGYSPQEKNKQYKVLHNKNRLTFVSADGEKKEFIFNKYIISLKLSSPKEIVLFSDKISPSPIDKRYSEFFYSHNERIKRQKITRISSLNFQNIDYLGFRNKYFIASTLKNKYNIRAFKKNDTIYVLSSIKEAKIYVGPELQKELKPYGLDKIIYYGTFHFLVVILIKLLYLFYAIFSNWGVSIILLAIFVYFSLLPLTAKSTKAMQKIQELQPHIEALKIKYGDNPQKLQKEQLELFKKHRVNPMGGCLPLIFQAPIMFILYYHVLARFIELKGASFLWIKDLSLPDHAFKLPAPLPYINILPILLIILGLLQHKITTSTNKGPGEHRMMGLFFSVFLGVIFYNFASALVLYWTIQTFLTLLYQVYTKKKQALAPSTN